MFRLPRALRDGVVLDSAVDIEPLREGHALAWDTIGVEAIEDRRKHRDHSPAPPVDMPELSWQDRACASEFPWLIRGQPIAPNEGGSTYEVLRSTIASVCAAGNIREPDKLYALFHASAVATGRDLDEVWRLCQWTTDRQAEQQPEEAEEDNPELSARHVTPREWDIAAKALGPRSSAYRNIREGAPLAANPRTAETQLLQAARQLATHGMLDPHALFSVLSGSAQAQRAPMPSELWARCAALVQEYEGIAKAAKDQASIARAYCAKHPLMLKLPGTRQVFILNAQNEPPTYEVTDTDTVLVQAKRGFSGLPFKPRLRDSERGVRPLADLLYDYGDVVTKVDFESGMTGCRYDSLTRTMFVGVHGVDPHLKPLFDERVDTWLRKLGGENYPDLERWLSCVTFTRDEPLAALYLDGPPGCGKSRLATTMARVWGRTTSPSDYSRASVARFNATLTDCPLVFADEGIRVAGTDQYQASEVFRTLVSEMAHKIEPKGKEVQTLHAALRVLVAANGPDGVPFKKALDADGLSAITERILYIRVPRNPVPDPDDPGSEVDSIALWFREQDARSLFDAVPGHMLWLRDNVGEKLRNGKRTGRFLVSGKMSDWHRKWAASQGYKTAALEVVDKLLRRAKVAPAGLYIRLDPQAREVLVHSGTLYETWDDLSTAKNPGRNKVNETLRQVSSNRTPTQRRFGNERKRVWLIPWQMFLDTGVWDDIPQGRE
jgi:hypothetical protein